jgi:hypothetical protein
MLSTLSIMCQLSNGTAYMVGMAGENKEVISLKYFPEWV